MKYTKYDKLIDESYPEKRQAVYERLKKELNLPDAPVAPAQSRRAANAAKKPAEKKSASKWRTFFKHPARLAACLSAAMAVFCLAIILPFTLNGSGSPATTPTPPTAPTPPTNDRFCKVESCNEINLCYSLKEYSARNKLSLLYIDWYDIADIQTSLHVDKRDQTDIVFLEEVLMHKGTGSIAELYITDLHTQVDKVEDYRKECNHVYIARYSYAVVFWGSDTAENGEPYTYTAYFTFGKYRYTVVLRYPMNENSIFELIDSMLPKIRRTNY